MKSGGYILLALVSLITFTPTKRLEEIPVAKIHLEDKKIDSLNIELTHKIDSLEHMKEEVIILQKEMGIRE